jgi:hypothetical protein
LEQHSSNSQNVAGRSVFCNEAGSWFNEKIASAVKLLRNAKARHTKGAQSEAMTVIMRVVGRKLFALVMRRHLRYNHEHEI